MGNYLKLFKTEADYEAESNKPTVSHIIEDVDIRMETPTDPCESKIIATDYEWVEIGGIKWATKNVGATSVYDYGQFFSGGGGVEGYTHDQVRNQCREFTWADYEFGGNTSGGQTKYNRNDGKIVLDAVDDAATVNMGSSWRMPTNAEFKTLTAATTYSWVTNYQGSGVNGILLTSKTDSSKKLFFPATGECYDGVVAKEGSGGSYWSSSIVDFDPPGAYLFSVGNNYVNAGAYSYRQGGRSVRGVLR